MDKFEATRVGHFMDRLAVKTEPGMTNTQLMLINFDLKPGTNHEDTFFVSKIDTSLVEPERRQWGSYNFVAFWIADSFNVVS
jgi:NCS1 family nucleobase:cation symporter-1